MVCVLNQNDFVMPLKFLFSSGDQFFYQVFFSIKIEIFFIDFFANATQVCCERKFLRKMAHKHSKFKRKREKITIIYKKIWGRGEIKIDYA